MRPLGAIQSSVLAALRRHGYWPNGWVWDTEAGTRRVLDSLVKRGLVSVDTAKGYPTYRPVDVEESA